MTARHLPPETFPSKRDGWITVLIRGGAAAALAGGIAAAGEPAPLGARIAGSLLPLAMAGLMLWILYGTRYELRDDVLRA